MQKVVEIVSHTPCKPSYGLHLLRLKVLDLFFHEIQFLFLDNCCLIENTR